MIIEDGKINLGSLDLLSCSAEQAHDFASMLRAAIVLGHPVTVRDSGIGRYGVIIVAHAELEPAKRWRCAGERLYPCDAINSGLDLSCARCEKDRQFIPDEEEGGPSSGETRPEAIDSLVETEEHAGLVEGLA